MTVGATVPPLLLKTIPASVLVPIRRSMPPPLMVTTLSW